MSKVRSEKKKLVEVIHSNTRERAEAFQSGAAASLCQTFSSSTQNTKEGKEHTEKKKGNKE